jgi:hypothetical protein
MTIDSTRGVDKTLSVAELNAQRNRLALHLEWRQEQRACTAALLRLHDRMIARQTKEIREIDALLACATSDGTPS